MKPPETIETTIAGKKYTVIATPTQHIPGNRGTGFIVTGEDVGHGRDSLPNAIYFTGDTVYIEELKEIGNRYLIKAAVMNRGNTHAPVLLQSKSLWAASLQIDCFVKSKLMFWSQCITNLTPLSLELSCVRLSWMKQTVKTFVGPT